MIANPHWKRTTQRLFQNYFGNIGRRCFSVATTDPIEPNSLLVDHRHAPADFDVSSAVVYQDVVSEEESNLLVDVIDGKMRRRRYERGHWDAVIIDYKELEILDEDYFAAKHLLQRIRNFLQPRHLNHFQPFQLAGEKAETNVRWLPCHAIDLSKEGQLQAHVDSVRFSGDLVAGLSLLSASIMRLRPDGDNDKTAATTGWVDLFLPPRSLYTLTGVSRYQYTHELLPCGSTFAPTDGANPIQVQRDRRLSVIFRDAKKE